MPEAAGWQVQHFYLALDILHEHWEALLASHLDTLLTDDERRRQFLGTTSMYFEAELTEREIALLNEKWDDFERDGTLQEPRQPRPLQPNEHEFRMRGHNKDGHPESPQREFDSWPFRDWRSARCLIDFRSMIHRSRIV